MQYQVEAFRVAADDHRPLELIIGEKLKLRRFSYRILNHSIDARKKEAVCHQYRLKIDTEETLKGKNIFVYQPVSDELSYPTWKEVSPVVVGFGPSGMFASLYLARCGAKPIILERGSMIEDRKKQVEEFIRLKKLLPNSNVQFGEGGAGTFSDGKLTTNLKDPLIRFILKEFVRFGAKEDILYESMPHIGTDYLVSVVANMRKEIIRLGGTFYFETTFQEAVLKDSMLEVMTADGKIFHTRHLLLGIGHSARDTYRNLYRKMHLQMEQKSFSMGVRIEHLARKINESQYGRFAKDLPAAYYKLATHTIDRGIYTFCMCPGGYVLASASEENRIVTNGMSYQARDGQNSNSAVLVEVRPQDYDCGDVLDGVCFQEEYEKKAYAIANDGRAPANLVKEFLEDRLATRFRSVSPTYPHGVCFADLARCLPSFVVDSLKTGISEFDKKLHGFADPDAVLIGIESRTSSPVRILRDENRMASMEGVYPIGEGAGYAGGIVSSALDGLKTAIKIAK